MVQDVVEQAVLEKAYEDAKGHENGHANGHPMNGHANGRPINGQARGPAHQQQQQENDDDDEDGADDDDEDDQTDENIFWFWPNIIGYVRIFLCVISLHYMPIHPRRCSFIYSISCLLDALDGVAARHFEQSTRFGAVLDMVTDRCSTTCLLVFLSTAKPAYSWIFQGLISLDLASHYMHMYATLAMGGRTQSHKSVDARRSLLMNLYYSNRTVLFVTCALNELFFIALYLLCFSSPMLTPALRWPAEGDSGTSPATPLQPSPSVLFNPFSAAAMEMARANKMDSTLPWILTISSAPVMVFKQWVNVVQMVKASKWLAEGDRRDRKKLGLPRKRGERKAVATTTKTKTKTKTRKEL